MTKTCDEPISRSLTDITEWGRTTPYLNTIISNVVANSVQRMAEKPFGQHRSKRACVMLEWHHPFKPTLSLFPLLICWFWLVFDDFYMVLVHLIGKSDENHMMWDVWSNSCIATTPKVYLRRAKYRGPLWGISVLKHCAKPWQNPHISRAILFAKSLRAPKCDLCNVIAWSPTRQIGCAHTPYCTYLTAGGFS